MDLNSIQHVFSVEIVQKLLEHFLLTCNCLDSIRAPLVKEIINTCSTLFAKNKLDGNVNLLQQLHVSKKCSKSFCTISTEKTCWIELRSIERGSVCL
jgi:hypothetical protein